LRVTRLCTSPSNAVREFRIAVDRAAAAVMFSFVFMACIAGTVGKKSATVAIAALAIRSTNAPAHADSDKPEA
jgi:hypothetical protein